MSEPQEDWLGAAPPVTHERRVRRGSPRKEARIKTPDKLRNHGGGTPDDDGTKQATVEGGDGQNGGGARGGSDEAVHRPGDKWNVRLSDLEVQALRILKEAANVFEKEATINRATAFEKRAAFLMENADVLVGSRIVKLDSLENMLRETHQMIGAPKKQTEAGEDSPYDLLADWLNKKDEKHGS